MTRGVALAVASAVVALGVGAVATARRQPGASAARELRHSLDSIRPSRRFAFHYRSGGSQVLDCVFPNREFDGVVDVDRGLLVVRGAADAPIAVVTPRRIWLHRSLFAVDAFPTTWLTVTKRSADSAADSIRSALGVDLAGVVFAENPTADAVATATAALDVARSVRKLRRASSATAGARYRVEADMQKLATETPRAQPGTAALSSLRFDISLAGGLVRRIEVRGGTPSTGRDGVAWAADYSPVGSVPVPALGDQTPLDDVDTSKLAGRRLSDCAVQL